MTLDKAIYITQCNLVSARNFDTTYDEQQTKDMVEYQEFILNSLLELKSKRKQFKVIYTTYVGNQIAFKNETIYAYDEKELEEIMKVKDVISWMRE